MKKRSRVAEMFSVDKVKADILELKVQVASAYMHFLVCSAVFSVLSVLLTDLSIKVRSQTAILMRDCRVPDNRTEATTSSESLVIHDKKAHENQGRARELCGIPHKAKQNSHAVNPDLARSLHELSIRLSDMGRKEEALDRIQEAEAMYRKLAKQNSRAFTPNLANSLHELSISLSDMGRKKEALERNQEAEAMYRKLAKQNPGAFSPRLANSLHNLSIRLSDLGRKEEALERNQEVKAMYRELAKQNSGAFTPRLVRSLHELSICLREMGRKEEALECYQEAEAMYRKLAKQDPGAFPPRLAATLHYLQSHFSDVGRKEEALERTITAAETMCAESNPLDYSIFI